MMIRRTSLAIAVCLLVAACSGSDPAPPQLEETSTTEAPATTAEPPPSTSSSTTTPPPPAEISDLLGVGDSRYPSLGNSGYDVDHYNVDLTFDPEPKTLSARVEIEAVATQTLDAFSLDFIGFEITELTVDGSAAAYERQGTELIVSLPEQITTGQSFVTAVSYNGTPAPVQSEALPFLLGWRTDPSGTNYVVSEPDGGRSWLPLNDHPSDKAAYTFRVTVPDPLTAAANGSLVEQITDLGWSTWVWDSPEPMASYLATVVIGELEIIKDTASTTLSGIPIRNVLPTDVGESSLAVLERQGEMMEYFEDVFGPYPFQTYGIAVVDDFEGALETQTLSIFGNYMVESPRLFEIVLVHELAHQWFGNSLTPTDWGDIWLNEGFATYAEWLWIEHTAGRAALTATVEGNRNAMATIPDLPAPGNPPADDLFNASVYIRGGLVLHALRVEVGDTAFFEIVKKYATDYRDGGVTTESFIELAESVSQTDLTDLFDEWLFGEDVPELPAWSL